MNAFLKTLLVPPLRQHAIAALLDGFRLAQLAGIGKDLRGRGAIIMLHKVRPSVRKTFAPNAHLEVTPDFLDAALTALAADGYDFIAMDEVPARLAAGPGKRPFVAFTLDDGYRDNLECAAPVFRRHKAPFTVYVTSGFVAGSHTMWWETLAELIGQATGSVEIDLGAGPERFATSNHVERHLAFDRIAERITGGDEAVATMLLDRAAARAGIDAKAIVAREILDEAGLGRLVAEPLASLGAHTISHRGLVRLGDVELEREIVLSAGLVEDITGRKPSSFAYPYGDRRSVGDREVAAIERQGFLTAVTTSPSTLIESRIGRLRALPRVSFNGYFQKPRYASVLASGLPFVLTRRRDGLSGP